jgi:CBS-domain-containing membrane protein
MASLSPKATIAASAGALLGWSAALLGALEIAYLRNAYSFLEQDRVLALAALVGFCSTLLFVLSRSRLKTPGRLVLAGTAVLAFIFLMFWGALSVACANENCL